VHALDVVVDRDLQDRRRPVRETNRRDQLGERRLERVADLQLPPKVQ
jgi:hypothetical protein